MGITNPIKRLELISLLPDSLMENIKIYFSSSFMVTDHYNSKYITLI